METKKKNTISFEDHLVKRYGKRGTTKRKTFERKANAFLIANVSKEESRINRNAS